MNEKELGLPGLHNWGKKQKQHPSLPRCYKWGVILGHSNQHYAISLPEMFRMSVTEPPPSSGATSLWCTHLPRGWPGCTNQRSAKQQFSTKFLKCTYIPWNLINFKAVWGERGGGHGKSYVTCRHEDWRLTSFKKKIIKKCRQDGVRRGHKVTKTINPNYDFEKFLMTTLPRRACIWSLRVIVGAPSPPSESALINQEDQIKSLETNELDQWSFFGPPHRGINLIYMMALSLSSLMNDNRRKRTPNASSQFSVSLCPLFLSVFLIILSTPRQV